MADLAFNLNEPFKRAAMPSAAGAVTRVDGWRAFDTPQMLAHWDALARRCSEPNPFHEQWYLLSALRAHDPAGRVLLFTAWEGECLIGLLPLARSARYYGRPLPHLATWTHGNAFLGAPLVERGMERRFWHALLDRADSNARSSLFLHLPLMPLTGALHDALQAVLHMRYAAVVFREERALLSSDMTAQDYFEASLSGKKRKELRRQFARLAEQGAVRTERCDGAETIADWIEQFLQLEASGWKGKSGSALASHAATSAQFRSALPQAAAKGQLERLAIYLDDQPIAMLVQFISAPGAYSYKTAFDERFARYSPGVLLQRENLALLNRPDVAWCDSCASADHPMIDHLWRERRVVGHLSVAIGGPLRRALFRQIARVETRGMTAA